MTVKCWDCGDEGHVASSCPNAVITGADGKPPWCGSCDEITRLVDLGDKMMRCHQCHPLRGRMLPQHRRCPSCHQIVYVWDHAACDNHQLVGVQAEYVGWKTTAPARNEDSLRALALQQVAEARANHEHIDAWLASTSPEASQLPEPPQQPGQRQAPRPPVPGPLAVPRPPRIRPPSARGPLALRLAPAAGGLVAPRVHLQ